MRVFIVSMLLPLAGVAAELESVAVSASGLLTKSYARVSMMSSRSGQKTDFRSLKTSGTDDSGRMSESTILPNQSLVAAFGFIELQRRHQLMVAMIQSMESEETRTVATPFGPSVLLPGRISIARYRIALSPLFGLSASAVHVDTFGMRDPGVGLGYRDVSMAGGQNVDLNLSVPLTARSRADQLLTRATLRGGLIHRMDNFTLLSRLSHSRTFYKDPANLDKPKPGSTPSRGLASAMPSELDMVLVQREKSRSTGMMGALFQANSKLRLGTLGQMVYVTTFKNKGMWITVFKPLTISYALGSWEAGANFSLSSDILNYKSPSLPSQWTAGVNLSYGFGQAPGAI
jgi:hypothetical protein